MLLGPLGGLIARAKDEDRGGQMLLPRGSRESRHSPPGERRVPERSTCGRIDTSFLSTRLKRAPARAAIEASEAVLARRPAIVGKLLNLLPDGLVPEGLPGGRRDPRLLSQNF